MRDGFLTRWRGTNCELVTNALEIRQYLRIFFYAFSFRFRFRFINFTFTHKYVNNLLTLRSSLSSTFTALGALSIFFFYFSLFIYLCHNNKSAARRAPLLYRLTLEAAPCGQF